MYQIRVEADFCAAHFLSNYCGKCENLHGHNYKVRAYLKGPELLEGGLLFDFCVIKTALRNVCQKLDHTNLNDLKDYKGKYVFLGNPSSERLAVYIFNQIIDLLLKQDINITKPSIEEIQDANGKQRPYLYRVDVFESETSRASYSIA